MHLEFYIPSRGIIGLRTSMLTATAGEAIMAHRFRDTNLEREFQNEKRFIDLYGNWSAYSFALNNYKIEEDSLLIQAEILRRTSIGEHSRA